MGLIVFTGKHNGFTATFDADTQTYTVYRNGKFFMGSKYKFSDIQSYLN